MTEYAVKLTGMDSTKMSVVTPSIINVVITSSSNSFPTERRFNKNITIAELKIKLELITGASATRMKLELFNKDNNLVASLDFNDALLGSYPVEDGMRINVVDKSLAVGEFEDLSKVEKFEITPEDYAKKTDSVLAFKMKNKIGRFNPELVAKKESEKEQMAQEEMDLILKMKVGNRCEVRAPHQPSRRGTVMYLGETAFKPGYWIGIKYDEPLGRNDGSVDDKRYFECLPKYGGFVKPHHVEVGDFPEEDFGLTADDEDDEI